VNGHDITLRLLAAAEAAGAADTVDGRLNRGAGPGDALYVGTAHPIFSPAGDQ